MPIHKDMRSSGVLGAEVSITNGKVSASKQPINFLSNGCRGSKSAALLQTHMIVNCYQKDRKA